MLLLFENLHLNTPQKINFEPSIPRKTIHLTCWQEFKMNASLIRSVIRSAKQSYQGFVNSPHTSLVV